MTTDVNVVLRSRPRDRATAPATVAKRMSIVLALLILIALVGGQIVLPRIAAERLTASLSRNGQGVHVSISAFPAVELLFGEADSVNVRIARLVAGSHHVGDLLTRAERVGSLDARVGELETHGLTLHDVLLRKRGAALTASANVTRQAVQTILPLDLTLSDTPPGGNGLIVRGKMSVFGHAMRGAAAVQAQDGVIVLRPALPVIGFALDPLQVTLFNDPAVWVDRVQAVSTGSAYRLTATSHYR